MKSLSTEELERALVTPVARSLAAALRDLGLAVRQAGSEEAELSEVHGQSIEASSASPGETLTRPQAAAVERAREPSKASPVTQTRDARSRPPDAQPQLGQPPTPRQAGTRPGETALPGSASCAPLPATKRSTAPATEAASSAPHADARPPGDCARNEMRVLGRAAAQPRLPETNRDLPPKEAKTRARLRLRREELPVRAAPAAEQPADGLQVHRAIRWAPHADAAPAGASDVGAARPNEVGAVPVLGPPPGGTAPSEPGGELEPNLVKVEPRPTPKPVLLPADAIHGPPDAQPQLGQPPTPRQAGTRPLPEPHIPSARPPDAGHGGGLQHHEVGTNHGNRRVGTVVLSRQRLDALRSAAPAVAAPAPRSALDGAQEPSPPPHAPSVVWRTSAATGSRVQAMPQTTNATHSSRSSVHSPSELQRSASVRAQVERGGDVPQVAQGEALPADPLDPRLERAIAAVLRDAARRQGIDV